MADTTSVFYQIGQSVTSAVNSRFSTFLATSNSYTGVQTFDNVVVNTSFTTKAAVVQDLAGGGNELVLANGSGVLGLASGLAFANNTLSVPNLNVTGTTTSVSTTNTEITDKVLVLNKDGGDTAGSSGILVEGASVAGGSTENGSFTHTAGVWTVGTTTGDGSGNVTTTPGTLKVGSLQISSGSVQNLGDLSDFTAGLNA
jgi:hypothetical protein